jgi:uncharacterized membrane protein YhaH (DUF805 family)
LIVYGCEPLGTAVQTPPVVVVACVAVVAWEVVPVVLLLPQAARMLMRAIARNKTGIRRYIYLPTFRNLVITMLTLFTLSSLMVFFCSYPAL